ncbi:hypothetical protein DSM104299_01787 [Baekduia alba]|uniref:DUF4331 family protein n=1 Tax=Baekduia alba TaxID=2997333 RepID=UPI002340B233|nr:DUF4331 family protein [Baekduia alba]WCB93085.1 hypothetical protein DSM104299_01787 [Baekduia alba]
MSDHISGPRALSDPIADITDVYAFPSPERPGRLVLVMNTLPFAKPWDALSEGLIYRFRLRPLTPSADGDAAPFTAGDDEVVLDTVFSPHVHPNGPRRFEQEGTCTLPGGETVTFRVNDPAGGEGHGVRVFAGARWDPFIMDAPAALKTIATGKLAFTDPSSIYLDGKDVLSLVVELDTALLGGSELVAVVAETLTRGSFNVRIERVGRPEVKNMMLAPKQFDPVNRDLEIRDLYNMEDAFALADGYLGAYRARLNANLAFWDGLDDKADWTPRADGSHPLTELVLADYLVVDLTKPYVEHGSYWEIELAALRGEAHQTCGGRTLNDDVMDIIYTQIINAGTGPVIRDGVDRSTRPGTRTFPYLAEPNPDPPDPPEHH